MIIKKFNHVELRGEVVSAPTKGNDIFWETAIVVPRDYCDKTDIIPVFVRDTAMTPVEQLRVGRHVNLQGEMYSRKVMTPTGPFRKSGALACELDFDPNLGVGYCHGNYVQLEGTLVGEPRAKRGEKMTSFNLDISQTQDRGIIMPCEAYRNCHAQRLAGVGEKATIGIIGSLRTHYRCAFDARVVNASASDLKILS